MEASAIVEETTIVEAPVGLPVDARTFPNPGMGQLQVSEELRGPSLSRTAADDRAPAPPAT